MIMKTNHLDEHLANKRRQIMKNVNKLKADLGLIEAAPDGWITSEWMGKHMNMTARNARNIFRGWQDKGMCDVAFFTIKAGMTIRPVPHYKLNPKIAKAYGLPKSK